MKILIFTLALLFSTALFPTSSQAEWTKATEDVNGNSYYVDLERIRKHDGFIYYWDLIDLLKPNENGWMSVKLYNQGDCKLFRYKRLSYSFHKEPMGGGSGDVEEPGKKGWRYPAPNTLGETKLNLVCNK